MDYDKKYLDYSEDDNSSEEDLTDIYNHNGIDYYRSIYGILYDMKTHESCYFVGVNEIKPLKKESKKNIKKVIIETKIDNYNHDSDCEIFYEEDLINEYKNSFTNVENFANDIARIQLEDTDTIKKSIGYIFWLKYVKLID